MATGSDEKAEREKGACLTIVWSKNLDCAYIFAVAATVKSLPFFIIILFCISRRDDEREKEEAQKKSLETSDGREES